MSSEQWISKGHMKLVVFLLLLLGLNTTYAMLYERRADVLVVSGAIVREDLDDFILNLNGVKHVILKNSPGGDVDTAIETGYAIRERGIDTSVDGYCYSACSLIFLGGVKRTLTQNSILGFHGAVDANPTRYTGFANTRIIDYVRWQTVNAFPPDLAVNVFYNLFGADLLLVTDGMVDLYVNRVRTPTVHNPKQIGVLTN